MNMTDLDLISQVVSRTRIGITVRHNLGGSQISDLEELQGQACLLCRCPFRVRPYVVDHDHACCPGSFSCGVCVRGLLCPRCNSRISGVDWFYDMEMMDRASQYSRSARQRITGLSYEYLLRLREDDFR